MSIYHDEIEIEDMEYDEEAETYFYPCPCGDRFQITLVNIPLAQHIVVPKFPLNTVNSSRVKALRPQGLETAVS